MGNSVHSYDVVVRWSDEDRLGHVNNARYLTFAEDARLVWLADSPAGNSGVILARSEVDFRFPVHFEVGGRLVVETGVTAVGRSSVRVRQDVVWPPDSERAGEPVASTVHVLVCYDYGRAAPRPWTADERAWLARWQEVPD